MKQADLVLDLPKGSYTAEWVDSRSGKVAKRERFDHGGGKRTPPSPPHTATGGWLAAPGGLTHPSIRVAKAF